MLSGIQASPLNGFDLEINNGDYICIVGENGAGKSTLIKTLVGLIPAISGKVLLRGDIDKSDIGYLPQQREMQKDFPASVWEVVLSGCLDRLGFRPFYGHKERKLAADAIRELDLEDIKNESFRELSGGQRQRVLLARAIAGSKKVLVLDEPTPARPGGRCPSVPAAEQTESERNNNHNHLARYQQSAIRGQQAADNER